MITPATVTTRRRDRLGMGRLAGSRVGEARSRSAAGGGVTGRGIASWLLAGEAREAAREAGCEAGRDAPRRNAGIEARSSDSGLSGAGIADRG